MTGTDPGGSPPAPEPHPEAGIQPTPPITSVVVAVLTYERSTHLPTLLSHLIDQASTSPVPADVLVVDNNPDGRAEPVVRSMGNPGVHYVHEPEPGIAAGRNRAISWSVGRDAIAFLDDDETPSDGWLRNLLHAAEVTDAAGVTGPVVRRYPTTPSPLVHGMRRWDRVRRPTGSTVPAASSANLLLDLRFMHALGLRFNPAFGLTGGSDTLLTRQIVASGGRLVWCDEAIVFDHVTPERLTPTWLRGRGRRVGNTHARVSLALDPGPRTRVRLVAHGVALQAWGAGTSVAGLLLGDAELDGAGRWRRARGRGIVSGALGRTHFDYARPADGHVGPAAGRDRSTG